MRRRPKLVFSPAYVVEQDGHHFATRKFALAAGALSGRCELIEPKEPPRETLLSAHEKGWVERVVSARLSREEELRAELRVTPELSLAHRLAVSGTLLAAREALASGVGLHAGGGAHHAFFDGGEGYCLLNDLACAIKVLLAEGRIRRAAVVDLDVHQGNGTAAIFAGEPRAFTLSLHQRDIYPEKKQRGSLDVELPAGTGNDEYLAALRPALEQALAFKPELVLYQAGVDCAAGDRLGGLELTAAGLRRRDEAVLAACRERGIPVAVTLGGGYQAAVERTAALHSQTLEVFAAAYE